MADDQTLGVYAAKAGEYVQLDTSEDAIRSLELLMGGLSRGAEVLDLGCGPGHLAAQLRDQGYQVTAMDASAEMANVAMETYQIPVKVSTFADLTEVDAYDAILASFSLLHAPKSDMPTYLTAIHRALRPGGRFVIGLKTGQGEFRDRLGRFYAYYSNTEITGLLETAGFTVTDRRTGESTGLDGSVAPWIVIACNA